MKVWKIDSGYVKIRIMGKYPERLVNRCIENGIRLSNCERCGDCINADIRTRDFKRLRPIVRGTGLSVRTVSRRGAPVIKAALSRSAVFAASLLLMAAAVIAASHRLWFIKVDTVSIPEAEIKNLLGDMGFKRGALKRGLSASAAADKIESDPRVVNAKVAVKGVTLTAEITEARTDVPEEKSDRPAEIVADKDCVISFIAVSKGHAVTRSGMAVRKGETLITGDLSSEKEGYMVGADGLVLGEVSYSASATAQRCVVKKVRSGRSLTVLAVRLFGRELMLGAPFEDYELEPSGSFGFDAAPIPLGIKLYVCFERKALPFIDTDEGTVSRARLMAQERLFGLLPHDAGIIAINTSCKTNGDGSVTAVMTVTTVERIGSRREY